MRLFDVITLLGGLAFFLYGMKVLSGSLERMAGGKLERALKSATSNRFKSLALGIIITIAMNSSSAVTVMLVGLVNSGIMTISQAPGIIMGSNIGTTLTAWIISLVGISSDNILLTLLKPEYCSLIAALIGILLIMVSKKPKVKDVGTVLISFGLLMFGISLMGDGVEPLAKSPSFQSILTAFNNPILGVLVGAVFTGVIQSSTASVTILQTLVLSGNITYGMAMPIIFGQNIGTCITALMSSIGVSRNARKVSVLHVAFNVIGTAVFLILFYALDAIIGFPFMDETIPPVGVAIVHTAFNFATTLLLLPFSKLLVKIANFVVKDPKEESKPRAVLDERILATPSVAVNEANALTVKMMTAANDSLYQALAMLDQYDSETEKKILEGEDTLDKYEDELGTFLVQLSSHKLSDPDALRVSKMLHSIGDFERMGDHAVSICKSAGELDAKNLTFSEAAKKELGVIAEALREIISLTTKAYETNDVALAFRVEPLEQTIDRLVAKTRSRHISRLQNGECTIQLGFILADVLTDFERVSDHCSNVAVSVIELKHNSFDTHKYLNEVKYGNDEDFDRLFNEYNEKYRL